MAKIKSQNVLDLEAKRDELRAIKAEIVRLALVVKQEKINAKEARIAKAEAKARAAIERAQKRLEKLAKPVGVKAKRQAKRPSKPMVVTPIA